MSAGGAGKCDRSPPTVYFVSDVRLFREGLVAMLARHDGIVTLGHGSLACALDELPRMRPDVVLLEQSAGGWLGFCREALSLLPGLRIVAVAVGSRDADVVACAEAGICGCVTRDASVDDLVDAIQRSLQGEVLCSPRVSALLFARLASLAPVRAEEACCDSLTPRERQVARLVASGLPNKEIAIRLNLGHATVKNHVHNILQKLNLRRRGEIAVRAIPAEPAPAGPREPGLQRY